MVPSDLPRQQHLWLCRCLCCPCSREPLAIKGLSIKGTAKSLFQPQKPLWSSREWEAQCSKRQEKLTAKPLAYAAAVPAHARGPGMAPGTHDVPRDGPAGDSPRGCAGLAGLVPAWYHTGIRVGPWLRDTCTPKGCAQGRAGATAR